MKRFFLVATLVSVMGAQGALAEDRVGTIDNPQQMPDSITVTANRQATPLRKIASSVTIITNREIQATQTTYVADLLRTVPGLDVVQSGGPGKTTSIFLRGSNSHHTLVIVDGVEMNDPASPNGSFDFAHMNVENIQRIEILRGAQSVLYGSDAIGGVINIVTNRGYGRPQVVLQAEAGSYGSYNESIRLSGHQQIVDYSLRFSRKDSDGFSAIAKNLGGVETDGYENSEFSAKFGLDLGHDFDLAISGSVMEATADIDLSFGVLDDPNFYNESKAKNFGITLSEHQADNFWSPSFGLYVYDSEFLSINEPDADHPDDGSELISNGSRIKFTTQHSLEIDQSHAVTLGVETDVEAYDSRYESFSAWGPYADTVTEVEARSTGVYALYQLSHNDRWFATVGGRYEDHELAGNITTFRVTSAYLLDASGTKVRASYGTGFNAPSLFQLFHPTYGNAELNPEESTSWELGAETSLANNRVQFGVVYFRNDFDSLIGLDPNTFVSINIAKAESKGVELFFDGSVGNVSIHADYTHTKTVNVSDDTPIIRRPKNKFSLTVSRDFFDQLNVRARVLYVGERIDFDFTGFPSEQVTLDAYTVTDLSLSYALRPGFQLLGRINNLFDDEYQEVFTYATARRAAYVGARLTL